MKVKRNDGVTAEVQIQTLSNMQRQMLIRRRFLHTSILVVASCTPLLRLSKLMRRRRGKASGDSAETSMVWRNGDGVLTGGSSGLGTLNGAAGKLWRRNRHDSRTGECKSTPSMCLAASCMQQLFTLMRRRRGKATGESLRGATISMVWRIRDGVRIGGLSGLGARSGAAGRLWRRDRHVCTGPGKSIGAAGKLRRR